MAELVANCPRCGASKITFDLLNAHHIHTEYGWQRWYEVFTICRHCKKSTIFVLSENVESNYEFFHKTGFFKIEGAANQYTKVEGYISLKDTVTIQPPEYLPENIEKVFREGATCMSVNCFNAAGTMFRLCVDLASKAMLPQEDINGPNPKIRHSLGLRLKWLFDNNKLPESLKELSSCIKDDGNDGAHEGTLIKKDAEDLVDFTSILLERIYTEPKRLLLAEERRKKRKEIK